MRTKVKTKTKTKTKQPAPVQVRLSASQLAALEEVRAHLLATNHPATLARGPGGFTRSDCLRLALELGLIALRPQAASP